MPPTFEQAKDEIARLVKHFATNHEAYRAPAYKEAHARQEFMDPFFAALGWDVHNAQQLAPDYREVVIEDTVEIQGQKKAPDYVFRVGRERKFFAEAKKPGVDLKKDSGPAYQLRRYAWTAKLPLSLLTDFEELAVYDCRARPFDNDKASAGRVNYYAFEEYPDRWREIWDVFSREAVWGGSFDQYVQAGRGKRGTSEVDAEFLKEIENWRDALARNMALRNPRLTIDELNDAVQRTIDRIIFLRMAEDRGIEDYGRLSRLADGDDIYKGLVALFRHADARYNSGLFDFSRGSGGDPLTPGLKADDRVLKPILASLYFPQSPYEFSVLPVEILGNVYEQFLGKVIRLTAAHQAKVEEKPEVKKAGGVYYTPAYIVEYIVKNTVGAAVAGKSPQQLKGFRVLDPACGSGSFLLGAYQCLLDYYLNWYMTHEPEKHPKAVWQLAISHPPSAIGQWRLTTAEKKRILLEHIFGVDIDRQAVEVTKLSLLLKVLETESDESLGRQLALFHEEAKERALPNLDRNIKCGNSLIGPDYFGGQLIPEDDELKRVNPFDWAKEFPQVMEPAARALWFATFVTHNSRVSERMLTYGVQTGEPLIFSPDDQVLIAEKIFETCRREGIAVVAANVLPDHVHLVVAAEDEKTLEEHLRKIKGASSFAFQRARGWEKGSHQHVWAQKFHRAPIADQTALTNILEYVHNNHLKHAERWGETLITTWDKGLKPLVRAGCVSVEEACQPRGGFDCVIGNPPYVILNSGTFSDGALAYLGSYQVAQYKTDLFHLFIQKGIDLLRLRGCLGYIVPNTWFTLQFTAGLREYVLQYTEISELVVFRHRVFENADVHTGLIFLRKVVPDKEHEVIVKHLPGNFRTELLYQTKESSKVKQSAWSQDREFRFETRQSGMPGEIAKRIVQSNPALEDVARASLGAQAYNSAKHTREQIENRVFHAAKKLSKEYLPELAGNDVGRYVIDRKKGQWIRYGPWLHDYRPMDWLTGPRILIREVAGKEPYRIYACYVEETYCNYKTILNVNPSPATEFSMKYLLGILNSRLLSFLYPLVSNKMVAESFPRLSVRDVKRLPIRLINFPDPAEKAQHDRMVKLIEQMLDLHKRLTAAQDAGERGRLQRLIDSTDPQIDALVYELYGLTPEEIAIVEGRSA